MARGRQQPGHAPAESPTTRSTAALQRRSRRPAAALPSTAAATSQRGGSAQAEQDVPVTRTRVFPSAMVLVCVGEKRVRRAERGCLGVGGSAARRGRDRTLAPRGWWQHPGSRAHVKNGRGAARCATRAGALPHKVAHPCTRAPGNWGQKYCECGVPGAACIEYSTACATTSPTGGGWRRRQRRASATLSRPAREPPWRRLAGPAAGGSRHPPPNAAPQRYTPAPERRRRPVLTVSRGWEKRGLEKLSRVFVGGERRWRVATRRLVDVDRLARAAGRRPRASPPMEPTVQPNGHVCTTCGAVTGSPNAELKLRRSRLKLGLVSTSLAVGLFCGTPVFPQMHYRESP